MTTSLAAQLKKLRTPQTNLLLQDKKHPSLLFDPKKAAELDKDTVLNIGQSGLQELIKLCTAFEEFETTLFAQSTLSFQRAVQDTTVNRNLDAKIAKFLILLSPYFLLNSSHKALEWLIHRYYIHEYNKDQYMLLILPYYQSRIFVRALQLVNLQDEGDKWHWLAPLQTHGVPLASGVLINRLCTDNGFLKMLCFHVITATSVVRQTNADKTLSLNALYAFYTISVLGIVEQLSTISEMQMNCLLPTLLYGLESPIADLTTSSYMIMMELFTKVTFKADIMKKLLLKIVKNKHLRQEAVTFLLYLYQSSNHPLTFVPESLVLQLSNLSWFIETVHVIHTTGTNTSRFIASLLQTACQVVIEDFENTSNVQSMITDILTHIRLNDDVVDTILSNVLTKDFFKNDVSQSTKDFLAQFYQTFERSYPERFDEYLKNLMKQSEKNKNIKQTLHFLVSWSFCAENAQESVDILDKLTHINAEQRVIALEILAKHDINVPASFREMLTRTLKTTFYDSEVDVVKALLSFSKKKLISLFPIDSLMDDLLILLSTCHTRSRKVLAKPALEILLELCEESDNTSVFVTALPYLFPAVDEDVSIAMKVLHSKFGKNNLYMQHVTNDIDKSTTLINAEAVTSAAFHNILNYELLPATENMLNFMRQQVTHGDATSLFFNMILLGSVCRVPVGSMPANTARDVIEMATDMINAYPCVKLLHNCNNITGNNIQAALKMASEGILPLQAGTYILEMVHRRLNLKDNPKIDFEENAEYSNLILRLLEMFFAGMDNPRWSNHYSRCLQIFFQRHFTTMQNLILFLSQLYTKPVNLQTSYQCMEISLTLLSKCASAEWVLQDQNFVSSLLISLTSRNNDFRIMTLNIMKTLAQSFSLSDEPFLALFEELVARSAEISIDADQLSLSLYFLLSPDPDVSRQIKRRKQRKQLQQTQKLLFNLVITQDIPMYRRSQLLEILIHVNSTEILQQLAPLGLELLQKLVEDPTNQSIGSALRNILQRFNNNTVNALNDEQVWSFFVASMLQYDCKIIMEDGEELSPSVILFKQINETFFESVGKVSSVLQANILSKMLDAITDCEITSVFSCASKTIRRIRIDAAMIAAELELMKTNSLKCAEVDSIKKKKRQNQIHQLADPASIHSKAWERGIALLEFTQRADNIEHEEVLYKVLFDLLNLCLSLEEQCPVEYTNQLILSTIHRLITKGLPVGDASLRIACITKCIRTSRNPQTHHHALLVLVELLKNVDVTRALFNIMPIFTFMGSTLIRQDDAYSIQIISKTLETVVPIINATNNEIHACELLRIFIVSLPDIPEHRRIPLFGKLLQLLDNYLHYYYLLTFESHALANIKITNSAQRLEFALQLSEQFSPQQLLQVCMKVAQFIQQLPITIEDEQGRQKAMNFSHKHVYDVTKSTPKNLRLYKMTAVQFLSNLLSSQFFIIRVAELNQNEAKEMQTYCKHFIVELILVIQTTSKTADQHQNKPSVKYWKVLLHHLYDVLALVNSLLPNESFLETVSHLICHNLLSVRKKGVELLNVRLLQKKFSEEDHVTLLNLIQHLITFMYVNKEAEGQEIEIIQQMVLISFKLLSRMLAEDHPTVFKPILEMATELLKSKDGPLLANAVLCIAELVSSMKAHALYSVSIFMPAILKLLKKHCNQNVPDGIVVSIVTALLKIVESMGSLVSLYLDKLLFQLIRLNSLYTDTEHPKIGTIVMRLKMTMQKISRCIPLRALLPAINRTYETVLTKKHYTYIPPLTNLLSECFSTVASDVLSALKTDITEFFLKVLQFREDITNSKENMEIYDEKATLKDIVMIEESASKALTSMLFKMTEETFKPIYIMLYNWAKNPQHKQRSITFYRLSANIAEDLKSLFLVFAGCFLQHAAGLLSSNNTFIHDTPQELMLSEESNRIELVEEILLTLHRVFSYNAHNFIKQEQFEALVLPIVNQIENTIGTKEEYENRAAKLIVPCIASFASAIPDDSMHKQLVYQTLLKTRHAKPYVRSTALNALVEIARKLGEDFMPLLPETVPFLAELLEDENEDTEKCAQDAVRTLEEILDEPLQKYF